MKRWTVVVSTLTAVLLLGAGVTADPQRAVSVDELAGLRSDLEFQVRTAYRFNVPARDARLAAMERADRAWRESPQSEADRQLMAGWLRGAIAASMPGSRAPLPETPVFRVPAAVAATVAEETVVEKPIGSPTVFESPALPVENTARIVPRPAKRRVAETKAPQAGVATAPAVAQPSVAGVAPKPGPEFLASAQRPVVRPAEESSLTITKSRALTPRRPAVGVNLAELTVRVATYHDLLDEIEAAVAEASAWDAEAVESFRRLVTRAKEEHRFATLYYGILSAKERDRVLRPRDPKRVVRAAAEAVKQWRALQDRDFLAP